MQLVKTEKGYVSGTVTGEPGREIAIFKGIPFAAPPVRELRWKPPQPVKPWQGIHECTQFMPMAPQESAPPLGLTLPMSEDCLYLNVLTPAKKANEKLPVMVWLHTGGYTLCTGNDKLLNHYRLPQNGVVLATVNHRSSTAPSARAGQLLPLTPGSRWRTVKTTEKQCSKSWASARLKRRAKFPGKELSIPGWKWNRLSEGQASPCPSGTPLSTAGLYRNYPPTLLNPAIIMPCR
jgi:hypothetical protein